MRSALQGELVQNEDFLKASLKGLSRLIEGCLEAVPNGTGLLHKKGQVNSLVAMLGECQVDKEIYTGNCLEGRKVVEVLLKGLKQKALPSELAELMEVHC